MIIGPVLISGAQGLDLANFGGPDLRLGAENRWLGVHGIQPPALLTFGCGVVVCAVPNGMPAPRLSGLEVSPLDVALCPGSAH